MVDIVNVANSDEQVNEIMNQFIDTQSKFGNKITETSPYYVNIKLLTQLLFCKHKEATNLPIVAPIPMGQGKSSLLVEFTRYMYQFDNNFGAIVVKKTIDECKEFAIDSGMVEIENCPEYEEYFLSDKKERGKFYDNNEELFKALVVRGFNFKDCRRYENKEGFWDEPRPNAVDYDYRLCKGCFNKNCSVRKSKDNFINHRILSITHNRLFLSTDKEDLLEKIMYFKNDKGEMVKRQLLVIDEKMEMCDIQSITINQFNKLKEIIDSQYEAYSDLFKKIGKYLKKLRYPNSSSDDIFKQNVFYSKEDFEFDEDLRKGFYLDKDIKREHHEQLLTLEKLLGSKNITTSIKYVPGRNKRKNNLIKQVTVYNYIDLAYFKKSFEKSTILDATAELDMDYIKSNIVFCDGIIHVKPNINLFIPKFEFNVSKSKITGTSLSLGKEETEQLYNNNVEKIARECHAIITNHNGKTLIVVYQNINGKDKFNFKKDINKKLKEFQTEKTIYKLIHHGQFSTGVNHLSDYTNVIIVGQLNKSSNYYQNKSLSLGLKFIPSKEMLYEMDIIQENDYLITNIQQIGRSSIRKGITPNIYILHKNKELGHMVKDLKMYFNFDANIYQNVYYSTERKEREQKGYNNLKRTNNSKMMVFVNHVKSLSPGVYLKKSIQENILKIKDRGQFSNIVKGAQNYLFEEGIENIEFRHRDIVIKAMES